MAKIISLKTRQVLADLPSIQTPRLVRPFKTQGGTLQGKLGVIAWNAEVAQAILNRCERAVKPVKKAS
jgi:carbamoylphosphate synthase large subunit